MSVKVAINGFGRIGRLAFRQMFGAEGYEVVAINDLTSPKMLAHLLKYDSSQGRYVNFGEEDQVTADDEAGTITVKGKTIKIYKEPDANNCPWGEIGVDVVLECSGFYTSKAKAQAHINAGAKKVVISAPAGNDLKTIVYNVNHETLTKEDHIITLEDPLEFLHQHKKSIVSQREVNMDTVNYVTSLRAALRQSPDVILLGEMRDYETIQVVMTAAETGHLVFSTLHTIGAANTIERIIDVFPPNQQRQIMIQLASVLQAVISQQLIPTMDGTLIPVFEIMEVTPAIRNMIRENKVHQIDGLIYSSTGSGMISMDQSLINLYKEGQISKETAILYASNPEMIIKRIR